MPTFDVKFISEAAGYRSSLGWYDTETGFGEILFGDIDADLAPITVVPGETTVSFTVDQNQTGNIGYFLIPDGGRMNGAPSGPVQVVERADGTWGIAPLDGDGAPVVDIGGNPVVFTGAGTTALFSEADKNPDGVDHVSGVAGPNPTAETLAADTADCPTGLLAWEDLVGSGDASYADVVFNVTSDFEI